jgi:hypothetical protein
VWLAQRRLRELFDAGLVERFRPLSLRGSYPWTYHLGERMHAMLRDSGVCEIAARYRPRVVHEFGHVLHELQLDAWVLAYRRGGPERDTYVGRDRILFALEADAHAGELTAMRVPKYPRGHPHRDEAGRVRAIDLPIEMAGQPRQVAVGPEAGRRQAGWVGDEDEQGVGDGEGSQGARGEGVKVAG